MAAFETTSQAAYRMTRSKADPLVLLGGGQHARVVADAAREAGWEVQGYVAPEPTIVAASPRDLRHMGDDSSLLAQLRATVDTDRPRLVIAFGGVDATSSRKRVANQYSTARWATIVHPAAWVSGFATLAPGAVVFAGAVINAGASIGRHSIVNTAVIVEHDVIIGDFVQLSPGAIVGGGAQIADEAFIGLGAIVRDHVSVGARATVGMGAVVVADVPEDTRVLGSPARPLSSTPEPE